MLDEKIFHICNNGVLVLNEPYVPGAHGKAVMFRDWARKALRDNEEWRIEAWQKSLRQLDVADGTGNEGKSTSDLSQVPLEPTDWSVSALENTLSEVAEPGMCESISRVFGSESNASEDIPKDHSEQLPPISKTTPSSGTPSGQIEIPSLPF